MLGDSTHLPVSRPLLRHVFLLCCATVPVCWCAAAAAGRAAGAAGGAPPLPPGVPQPPGAWLPGLQSMGNPPFAPLFNSGLDSAVKTPLFLNATACLLSHHVTPSSQGPKRVASRSSLYAGVYERQETLISLVEIASPAVHRRTSFGRPLRAAGASIGRLCHRALFAPAVPPPVGPSHAHKWLQPCKQTAVAGAPIGVRIVPCNQQGVRRMQLVCMIFWPVLSIFLSTLTDPSTRCSPVTDRWQPQLDTRAVKTHQHRTHKVLCLFCAWFKLQAS